MLGGTRRLPGMLRHLARVLFVMLVSGAPSWALSEPCPGGRFETVGPERLDRLGAGAQIVIYDDGQVSFGLICPPMPARIWAFGRRTRVRVRWPSCHRFGRQVIRARIDRDCSRMIGVLLSPGRIPRRFKAFRISE